MLLIVTLLPRTLLGRTALIIVATVALSQLVAFQLFRLYYYGPMLNEIAGRAIGQIRTVAVAMQILHDQEREEFLDLLEAGEGVRVLYDAKNTLAANTPPSDFLQALAKSLRKEFGDKTEFFLQPQSRALWVKVAIANESLWIGLPRTQVEQPFPWQSIGAAAGVGALALIAAYWLIRRVIQPLQDLSGASRTLGAGRFPEPVVPRGPEEIQALGRTFNTMIEDLQRQEEDRAVLLAGISHDLRTPLARLRLGIEMLQGDDATKADMVQDTEDMEAIVKQFLDFARAGGDEASQPTDLNALVREVCEGYLRRNVAVGVQCEELPTLSLRQTAMRRALSNLLDNAVKYGGGAVDVRTAHTYKTVTLMVADRGPGIPTDQVERMLRPFTRLETARTNASGSGLGLAIVSRIARSHGGTLRLNSRDGGGLEASLELPIL